MSDYIAHDHQHDGIDRKGFLTCMAWAGTGVLWTLRGGRATAMTLAEALDSAPRTPGTPDFSFVQISDSHIGFHKAANKNVIGTFGYTARDLRPRPFAGRLPQVGVGDGGQHAGAGTGQALQLCHSAQRAYPPDHQQDRGQHRHAHRRFDGLSVASARTGRPRATGAACG